MPRTPIPEYLIHRPADVELNGERFDHLCHLTEEVAFPIVKEALVRETADTGAEVLTEEAKYALEALVEEAAFLENLDDKEVLQKVRTSLTEALPQPDEDECRQHAKDLSQVLMGTWLETLRSAQSKAEVLALTDHLLPSTPLSGIARIVERFVAKPTLPPMLSDALASFATNDDDVASILATLRLKFFPDSSVVDLPFGLALVGAPEREVLAMRRSLYDGLVTELEHQIEIMDQSKEIEFAQPASEFFLEKPMLGAAGFRTATAQRALEHLSEPLPAARYKYLVRAASQNLQAKPVVMRVQHALKSR